MANPVSQVVTQFAALSGLVGVGAVLTGAKVHLYQNNISPLPTSVLSDFTECDYGGYVEQAIGTWGAPYVWVDGLAHITADGLQFQPTDAVTPNTAFGAYITNVAGTVLYYAVRFDAPVPMIDATTGLVYEPDFVYGS